MRTRFKDKVVVVVGGNSGIGLASARAFAEEGGQVVLTGRDPRTLAAAAAEIGHGAVPIKTDISDLKQIDALMDTVKSRFGRIDVLFVNAGVGAFIPIENITEKMWDDVMNANLKGLFFTIQKALPMMGQGGAIVLTSSIAHAKGTPTTSAYAASKAGVRSLGRTLAAELVGRGIRVNVVSPGPIETPIINRTAGLPAEMIPAMRAQMIEHTPMKRMGRPEEVAAPVLFLASGEASFITGEDLLVDSGLVNF
ncbi:MAG: SDR family oxidoreductase [Alphaproteobacteria bacterium]|nr:SDR family oxidoreductase [Alphaproteobacteria bacterium]MBU6473100.1 SDR family oxidoreductase [Alphaproteobacteria bacterium]MDE2013392.1 SDR family oxidoreductase [Alphaproteobacteria bacterium]MDE2074439.1 SDR family oxidoreductase [Alphaproteobacteria bacterium]MDE2350906.1 SDR family oxidoreductase [Alphaproteobacteria bacterium]